MQSNHSTEGVGKCQEGHWKNLSGLEKFVILVRVLIEKSKIRVHSLSHGAKTTCFQKPHSHN